MTTLVRALKAGFANGRRIRAGTEFELADGVVPGKWLTVIKVLDAKKTRAEAAAEVEATTKADKKAKADTLAKQNAELRNIAPPAPETLPAPETPPAQADDLA